MTQLSKIRYINGRGNDRKLQKNRSRHVALRFINGREKERKYIDIVINMWPYKEIDLARLNTLRKWPRKGPEMTKHRSRHVALHGN